MGLNQQKHELDPYWFISSTADRTYIIVEFCAA